MPKDIVNIPRKKWVGYAWVIITVALAFVLARIYVMVDSSPSSSYKGTFALLAVLILVLLAFTTFAYYRTKYVIKNGMLQAWSPFMVINLPLKNIRKVERTRVPVYLRVGASAYCGFFYIPGVGWTRAIITNMTDGVLIYAKDGKKYLITPSNPDKFAKLLKNGSRSR